MDKTERNPGGFPGPFLFFLCPYNLVIWSSVDVPKGRKKGRRTAVRWTAEQRGTAVGAANSGGACPCQHCQAQGNLNTDP